MSYTRTQKPARAYGNDTRQHGFCKNGLRSVRRQRDYSRGSRKDRTHRLPHGINAGYTDVIVKRYFRITGNKDQIQLIRDGAPADPAVYAEIFDDVGISSDYKEGEYE